MVHKTHSKTKTSVILTAELCSQQVKLCFPSMSFWKWLANWIRTSDSFGWRDGLCQAHRTSSCRWGIVCSRLKGPGDEERRSILPVTNHCFPSCISAACLLKEAERVVLHKEKDSLQKFRMVKINDKTHKSLLWRAFSLALYLGVLCPANNSLSPFSVAGCLQLSLPDSLIQRGTLWCVFV